MDMNLAAGIWMLCLLGISPNPGMYPGYPLTTTDHAAVEGSESCQGVRVMTRWRGQSLDTVEGSEPCHSRGVRVMPQ